MKIAIHQAKKLHFGGYFFTIFCQNTIFDIEDSHWDIVKIKHFASVVNENTWFKQNKISKISSSTNVLHHKKSKF